MRPGSFEHDELLWRLAMQLAAQLPVDKTDKEKVLDYIEALASPGGRAAVDELVISRKRRRRAIAAVPTVETG